MRIISSLHTILLLILMSKVVSAQVSVHSAGQTTLSSQGSVSFTVGQVARQYHHSGAGSVSEGVHQLFEIFIVSGHDVDFVDISIRPNPVSTLLWVTVRDYPLQNLYYTLYTESGQWMTRQKITEHEFEMYTEELPPGWYILEISDHKKIMKSFKIIKY